MMDSKNISTVFEELARQVSTVAANYIAGPVSVVPATAALPEGLSATLDGSLDRQLHIAVWEVSGKLSFVFRIGNTQAGQVVYVRDLLKALNQSFSYDDFKFDSIFGASNPQEVARQMASTLTANQKVVEILRGTEWLDVPFDWAGMR